jgi:hypothetical protein
MTGVVPIRKNAPERGLVINGDLRTFDVAQFLQFLASSRVTGTFWAWSQPHGLYMSFEQGKIVAVMQSDEDLEHAENEDDLMSRAGQLVSLLMTWSEGQFGFSELKAAVSKPDCARVEVERVLLNAAWLLDETSRGMAG